MPRDRFDTSETSGGIGVSSYREGFSYEIRTWSRLLREAGGRLRQLVDLAFSARLGGDNCGGYDHSDECESDQDIVHGVLLLLRGSSEPFHTLIIG